MAKNIPTLGLAIDWETSGYSLPDYASKHQGISIGAAVFNLKTFEPIETYYQVIKFNKKYEWDLGAEKIHGLSREFLYENGVSQEDAALEFGSLILKYFGDSNIVLLGHRCYFDRAFTNQLFDSVGMELPWNSIQIDSAAIALSFLGVTLSDDLFDICGMPPRKEHNALEDVLMTLESIKNIKQMIYRDL